jgi:hypothetical protein
MCSRTLAGFFLEAVETTELTVVQKVMREMGAKGGKIGGKRRLETMTDAQCSRSAKTAAKARWAKANTLHLTILIAAEMSRSGERL